MPMHGRHSIILSLKVGCGRMKAVSNSQWNESVVLHSNRIFVGHVQVVLVKSQWFLYVCVAGWWCWLWLGVWQPYWIKSVCQNKCRSLVILWVLLKSERRTFTYISLFKTMICQFIYVNSFQVFLKTTKSGRLWLGSVWQGGKQFSPRIAHRR